MDLLVNGSRAKLPKWFTARVGDGGSGGGGYHCAIRRAVCRRHHHETQRVVRFILLANHLLHPLPSRVVIAQLGCG
jgi:hypothetical protein